MKTAHFDIKGLSRDDFCVIKPIPCTVIGWPGFFVASTGPFMQLARASTVLGAVRKLVKRVGDHSYPWSDMLVPKEFVAQERAARNRYIEYVPGDRCDIFRGGTLREVKR